MASNLRNQALLQTHTLRHTQTHWQVLVQMFRHIHICTHTYVHLYLHKHRERGHCVLTASLLAVRSRRCSLSLRRLYCILRALIWNSFLHHTVTFPVLMLTVRKYSSLQVWATPNITFQRGHYQLLIQRNNFWNTVSGFTEPSLTFGKRYCRLLHHLLCHNYVMCWKIGKIGNGFHF